MDKEEMLKQIQDLKNKLDEKTQQAEDFCKWLSDEQQENNRLYKKCEELQSRVEELENQMLELSQAKIVSVMLTDSNAKGVL